MRGVKVDPDFMSKFISESIEYGHDSIDSIIACARQQISNIDKKIIEVEKLKVERSKLLAIVAKMETDKSNKKEGANLLPLFSIKNLNLSKAICNQVNEGISPHDVEVSGYQEYDVYFCIKDLCRHRVLSMENGVLLRGENYDRFLKSVVSVKI